MATVDFRNSSKIENKVPTPQGNGIKNNFRIRDSIKLGFEHRRYKNPHPLGYSFQSEKINSLLVEPPLDYGQYVENYKIPVKRRRYSNLSHDLILEKRQKEV